MDYQLLHQLQAIPQLTSIIEVKILRKWNQCGGNSNHGRVINIIMMDENVSYEYYAKVSMKML